MGIEKQKFSNNAATLLSSAINNVVTSISVINGGVFPSLAAGEYFYATIIGYDVNGNENAWEIVKVTAWSVNNLTVVRGQDGSTALAWPQSARIELRLNAGTMNEIVGGVSSQTGVNLGSNAVSYEDRGQLRLIDGPIGSVALIDGLGLFVWYPSNTEPDDDESCFATTNGRWLMSAVHWDVVDAWLNPEIATIKDKMPLVGVAYNSVASLAAGAASEFTLRIVGASPGDIVAVSPPHTSGSAQRGFYHASVTATDTVTILLCSTNAVSVFATGYWNVAVIKRIKGD